MPEQPDDDPMPQPPPPPDDDACCGQGCDPCVLEYFAAAMRHAEYERRNEEWFASIPGFDEIGRAHV